MAHSVYTVHSMMRLRTFALYVHDDYCTLHSMFSLSHLYVSSWFTGGLLSKQNKLLKVGATGFDDAFNAFIGGVYK